MPKGFEILEITFEEILPIWRNELWPNRESPIEPASSMLWLGGYDVGIKTKYKPRFFAVVSLYQSDDGKWENVIDGVNSGHQTSETHYRSRGIWTSPFLHRRGIGKMLIQAVENAAKEAGCQHLWSIPRQSALPFYERCGFQQSSEFFDEGMEFGPNCYVIKEMDDKPVNRSRRKHVPPRRKVAL